ncbi:MAG: LPS-assembly protein LptD, partial [Desulfotignum sp.]|nr:LPS-assembly protein LptD [Desulfotignum sp.]
DIVSDPDFLLEFQDGITGYTASNQVFEDQFGRDLDRYDDTIRQNSLTVFRSWDQYTLNIKTLWNDNVTARRADTEDTTLQTLPSIEFDSSRMNMGTTGLYFKLDSEFRSFYRQDTIDTATTSRKTAKVNGRRLDIYNKLFYPTRLAKFFSFEPFAGLRGTAYHTDSFTDMNADDDPLRFRGIYDMGGELSTRLNRVFTAQTSFSDKIQHQVTPALSYHFLPHVDQEDLPYFDSLDDIKETNKLTWSLTNRFTAGKTIDRPDGTPIKRYRELAWIEFFQDYDIKNERDGINAQDRPWSDIWMDARIYPFSFLSLNTDLAWSPYNYHFTALNANATVTDNRGDSVTTAYRYTIDTTETWYTRFKARISRTLSAYYSFEVDLGRKTTIETRTGILLEKACWAMGLEFKESGLDRRIAFMITLKGIGEFSTK